MSSKPAPTPTDRSVGPDETVVVEGVVERGDERGRTLGFPTANLADTTGVRLDGVYAGLAQIEPDRSGPIFVAAVSVGHRPTYYRGDAQRLLEAYLVDFRGDLYDSTLRVELRCRLRPQVAYVDTPTLVKQLHLDVAATRAWARANGLGQLLVRDRENDERWAGGRRSTFARRPKLSGDAAALRARRREARLMDAIEQAGDEAALSHARVAELSGLPVGYLHWRYPTEASLGEAQGRRAD